VIKGEITIGHHHIKPDKYPCFIARSYFHLPKESANEISNAGFKVEKNFAVEGPTWIVPDLDAVWDSDCSKKTILDTHTMFLYTNPTRNKNEREGKFTLI
jgi:hypothetical protein